MSKSCRWVTEEERIEIYALWKEGKTIPKMASAIRRNRPTIYREISMSIEGIETTVIASRQPGTGPVFRKDESAVLGQM